MTLALAALVTGCSRHSRVSPSLIPPERVQHIQSVLEKEPPSTQTPPEQLAKAEKDSQVKTWIERGKSYLEIDELEQALLSTEQVFRLDAQNREASALVDRIKGRARELGIEETLFVRKLYEEEAKVRVQHYVQQADEQIARRQWGAAALTLEKILLLDPENTEGRRLKDLLEKGKTERRK